jgi:hypothetical protein
MMSRELHFRKRDNKYNVWSTISDSYVYEWGTKEEIEKEWLADMIISDIDKIKDYMEHINKIKK